MSVQVVTCENLRPTLRHVFIGRTAERTRIQALIDDAARGVSGALVVRGELGTGATSLLRLAEVAMEGRGKVLRTAGVPGEGDFAFSGLEELVHPILGLRGLIPPTQAAALDGALALAEARGVGRLAIGAATLSLLAAASDDGPVLCLVDDADLVDAASADALVFAARRLQAEGIAMLFAAHDDAAFPAPGIPEPRLGGLPREEALQLLATVESTMKPEVADRLIDATGGNPLVLLSLPELLTEAQLAGREPIPHPVPLTDEIAGAYTARARGALSPEAQRALAFAAALDTRSTRVLPPESSEGLREAENAGLIVVEDGRLHFSDPLLRAAAYHLVPAAERRELHIEIAAALGDDPRYRERRAWHLSAGTDGPDAEVADELALAAAAAEERRASVAAAGLYERAARFSPTSDSRDDRLVAAAGCALHAGQLRWASALLTEAAVDPVSSPVAGVQSARIDLARGVDPAEVVARLTTLADSVAGSAPTAAAEMLALAAQASEAESSLPLAQRAVKLAARFGEPRVELQALSELARAQLASGKRAGDATLQEARTLLDLHAELQADPELLLWLAEALVDTRADSTEVDAMLAAIEEAARDHSIGTLPRALIQIAWRRFAHGALDDARIAAFEAAELFDETGERGRVADAEAALAFIAAYRGQSEEVEDHVERMRQVAGPRAELARRTADRVRGASALAAGDPQTAVLRLEPVAAERTLVPSRSMATVDLIDALVRVGEPEAARTLIGAIKGFHEPLGGVCTTWGSAIVEGDDAGFAAAERTLDALAFDRPLVRARIALDRGARLRRDGERREARAALRAALATFERLGAEPWAQRCRDELAATGEKLIKFEGGVSDELTPQELQVARVIADGASYKEAAARLFLSPKTIEFHLGKVYRKLGITSRRELAAALARHEESEVS